MARLHSIIRKKFRQHWSDLELLVILDLGDNPATFSKLVENTGASSSGIWNAIQRLSHSGGYLETDRHEGRVRYHLSPAGQTALKTLFE